MTTFSTGFQSNLGIISAIAGRNDYILCDKENHASIYDACRLSYAKLVRYEHNDMEDLENQLIRIKEADKEDTHGILIVTDGVFSMTGDICNLPEIVRLAKKYGARIMIDDAHGLGVLGAHGRGTAEHFGLEDEVDIYMGTFSKSLASLGGYMAAKPRGRRIRQTRFPPFIFSASITPASVESARAALRIIRREPERVKALHDISEYMREGPKRLGVDIIESETPIIDLHLSGRKGLHRLQDASRARRLCQSRDLAGDPSGQSLLRTSYTATHTKEQMDYAMVAIKEVLEILKNYE